MLQFSLNAGNKNKVSLRKFVSFVGKKTRMSLNLSISSPRFRKILLTSVRVAIINKWVTFCAAALR